MGKPNAPTPFGLQVLFDLRELPGLGVSDIFCWIHQNNSQPLLTFRFPKVLTFFLLKER